MTKNINLKENVFILLRKILAGVALASSCLCLCLLLSGFVTFWGRNMNLMSAVNGLFEIMKIGKKQWLFCLGSVSFSVLYIVAIVKIVIGIVSGFVHLKVWLLSPLDDKDTRTATRNTVYYANTSLWWLLFLCIFSYMFYNYQLRGLPLLGIILFILLNICMNFTKDVLFKSEIEPCAINAINNGIILISMIAFTFLSTNLQVGEFFDIFSIFSSNAPTTQTSDTVAFQLLTKNVLIPLFNLIMLCSLISWNAKINSFNFEGKTVARGLLIRNSVFLGIIIVCLGFTNRYTNFTEYVGIISKNMLFILITAVMYITAINQVKLPTDIGYYKQGNTQDTATEEQAENNSSENTAE